MLTSFDLTFAPNLRIVSVVRRFVLALYERLIEPGDVSAQMALVTHELLENAVKYSSDESTFIRVSMASGREPARYVLTVQTRNRARPDDLVNAERLIRRVRDTEDPAMLYQELIAASVESSVGSGLGIARIRAETDMQIGLTIEGDQIEIVAETSPHVGGGA